MRHAAAELVAKLRSDAAAEEDAANHDRAQAIEDCADALQELIDSTAPPNHYRWSERLDSSWDLAPPGSNHVCATVWANGAWIACDKNGDVLHNGSGSDQLEPIWLGKTLAIAACFYSKIWPAPEGDCTHSQRS